MKHLKVNHLGEMEIVTANDLDEFQHHVDGYIEIVRPMRLTPPYCMVVNEEGIINGLPFNALGSYLYGTDVHSAPIVGTILITSEGETDEGLDFVGLTEIEARELGNHYQRITGGTIRWKD